MSTNATSPVYWRMKSKPSGRSLVSPDGRRRLELAANVMETVDRWGNDCDFVVVKLWKDKRVCDLKAIDLRDGVVMAEGRGGTEFEAWAITKMMLTARGYRVD